MKPHVKLAKNEQVWHGVSSSYFSIFLLFIFFSSCYFFLSFFSFLFFFFL